MKSTSGGIWAHGGLILLNSSQKLRERSLARQSQSSDSIDMLQIVLRWNKFGDIEQRALKTFDLNESVLIFSGRASSILESANDFGGKI